MKLSYKVTTESLNNVKKAVNKYKKDIEKKAKEFVSELAREGIEVARRENNSQSLSAYITFRREYAGKANEGYQAIIYARDSGDINSQYLKKDEEGNIVVQDYMISPLLMVEFGSGLRAENPNGINGVGQGSLNTFGHAFSGTGWYYMDLDGEWHFTYGFEPKQPMYKASLEIRSKIEEVYRKVFQ